MTWREIREQQFKEVLQRLQACKPAGIQLCLAPAAKGAAGPASARGILSGQENWRPGPEGENSADEMVHELWAKKTARELRAGEVFWIGLKAAAPGRMFLFNLGASGSTALLAPQEQTAAEWAGAGEWLWVGEQRRLTAAVEKAVSFEETGASGPAAGYPERLLAISTTRPGIALTPADLNADWQTTYRGGWGKVATEASGFWAWSLAEFAWGEITLPVVP